MLPVFFVQDDRQCLIAFRPAFISKKELLRQIAGKYSRQFRRFCFVYRKPIDFADQDELSRLQGRMVFADLAEGHQVIAA